MMKHSVVNNLWPDMNNDPFSESLKNLTIVNFIDFSALGVHQIPYALFLELEKHIEPLI